MRERMRTLQRFGVRSALVQLARLAAVGAIGREGEAMVGVVGVVLVLVSRRDQGMSSKIQY